MREPSQHLEEIAFTEEVYEEEPLPDYSSMKFEQLGLENELTNLAIIEAFVNYKRELESDRRELEHLRLTEFENKRDDV